MGLMDEDVQMEVMVAAIHVYAAAEIVKIEMDFILLDVCDSGDFV